MFHIIGADGKEYGPVSAELLQTWMAQNRATLNMKCRRADSTEWRRLGDFPEFAAAGVVPVAGSPPVEPAPDTTAPRPGTPLPEAIVFTGEWKEYFKIWIVNVLLTVVTLGIYAAWAKVRRKRYFYANTRIFGHALEYLADPLKIFYGNLIVAAVFLLFALSGAISPLLQLPFMVLFAVALPWIIVRAFAFNARNSAWRGLRFMFNGRYAGALKAFLLWPLLVPLTLGVLQPYVMKRQKDFVIGHHHYGTTPFTFTGPVGEFYRIVFKALAFLLPILIGYFGLFISMARQGATGTRPQPAGWTVGLIFLGLPLALVGVSYLRARLFNLTWNYTGISGHRFVAEMSARSLLGLQIMNALGTALTLGLLAPWAAIRLAQFQVSSIQVVPAGPIDEFVAAAQPPVGAVGDVASEFLDVDLGFGL